MPFVRIRDIQVHYQQQGAGPDLILVHAFTSNLAVWMLTDILPALAPEFRVTCYDLRGHGATDATPTGYTSENLAQDLIELRKALELGPSYIVGHSYGGVIGCHAAILEPGGIQGLVLSDTFFPGLARLEPDMKRAAAWRDLQDTFEKAGLGLPTEVDFSALFLLIAGLDEGQLAELKKVLPPAAMRWLISTRKLAATQAGEEMWSAAGLDEAAITSINLPVIAMYDEQTPFGATRDFLANNLTHCTVDVVPDANHLGPVQNPKEFVDRVTCHLRRMKQQAEN